MRAEILTHLRMGQWCWLRRTPFVNDSLVLVLAVGLETVTVKCWSHNPSWTLRFEGDLVIAASTIAELRAVRADEEDAQAHIKKHAMPALTVETASEFDSR